VAPPDVGQRRSPLVLTISEVTLRPLSDFIEVAPGLGRVVALRYCSSTSYQVRSDNRSLFFLKRQCDRPLGDGDPAVGGRC
jgi:hypothetical protein